MGEKEKLLGITVKKDENFSEWYTQICSVQGADLVDTRYGVQGFVVHKPWAFKILRSIYQLLEDELEKDDHEPYLFPTVIPEENLMKEEEHAGFAPDVFWITEAGTEKLDRRVALRPTGETAIYPMYALWIRSHNDLPLKRYQSRITVFRNEKTTRPFLRGREFMFFESHDVFKDHKGVMTQINKDMEIMGEVARKKIMLPYIFFKRPQWDKFLGAEDTFASDTIMPDGKRNQMSSTHDLGQRFAKAYNVKFADEKSQEQFAHQTCFGPGIYRMMAGLIGVHGDDTGLVLPSSVAPLDAIIIPITFIKKPELSEKTIKRCREIQKSLSKEFKIKVDESDESPGFKYNHWEMLGAPIRIEVGPRELEENKVTIVRRTNREKHSVKIDDLGKEISKHLKLLDKEIEERAKKYFAGNTKEAKTLDEVKKIIEEHRGFIKVPFCSIGFDGEECADVLKAETVGGCVSGVNFESPDKVKAGQKCVICGKDAKEIVYVAKSY